MNYLNKANEKEFDNFTRLENETDLEKVRNLPECINLLNDQLQ